MPSETASLTPAQLLRLFAQRRTLLLVPAIVGAALAAFSTLVLPRDWKAEQGLLIRPDAAGYAEQRLGKFTDLSEMKTVQETLLELARSQSVVTSVLTEVGGEPPSAQDLADFRDKLRLTPPGGAEFGKTEVFYIGVLDPDRQRAIAFVQSLTRELDRRMNEVRDERAASLVSEVERSVEVARQQLHGHVERLAEFERSIGADLIELRHLTNPGGGQSEFGLRALAIEQERRQSIDGRRENEALLAELRKAEKDPSRLIATPDALLTSQPALRRLKEGLVDAQLAVARTAGVRTADHPFVLAARRSEEAVRRELIGEIPSAIAGVELELQVAHQREAALSQQLDRLRNRSAELASQRSRYAELVASVEGQTHVLEGALKQLSDAKAFRAGANHSSLLATIDGVETGANPEGPGRTVVTATGGLAGLLFGAALVFVLHAPQPLEAKPRPVAPTQGHAAAAAAQPPAASSVGYSASWAVDFARQSDPRVAPALGEPVDTTELVGA